jgi:hypothetical protein
MIRSLNGTEILIKNKFIAVGIQTQQLEQRACMHASISFSMALIALIELDLPHVRFGQASMLM